MPTHPLRFIRHFALLAGTLLAFGCFAEPTQPAQTVLAERIDLIRHGESEDNLNEGKTVVRLDGTLMPSKGKVLSGWNSASLTMRGVSQAVKAGEVLLKQEKDAPLSDHNRPIVLPTRDQVSPQNTAAANVIRGQLDAIYSGKSGENTPHTTPVQRPVQQPSQQTLEKPQTQSAQTSSSHPDNNPQNTMNSYIR